MEKESVFLWALIILVGFLSYLIVRPYLNYILAAFVLTFLSYPVYKAIRRVVRSHMLSSIIVIVLMFSLVIAPSFYVGKVLFIQTSNVLAKVGTIRLEKLDTSGLENTIQRFTGENIDLKKKIRDGIFQVGGYITRDLIRFVGRLPFMAIGMFIMLFTMFYLYKDGEKLVEELKRILPLKKEYKNYLFDEISKVTWAILAGHVLTAVIQGLLAAIGFYIFGISNALFWGFVTIIICLIPYLGPFIVFLPIGIYQIVVGNLFSGIGVLLFGFIILSNIDNILRPKFVHMQAQIHPVAVLLGIIGGISIFGLVGLIIGPLVLALFLALIRVYEGKDVFLENIKAKEERRGERRRGKRGKK